MITSPGVVGLGRSNGSPRIFVGSITQNKIWIYLDSKIIHSQSFADENEMARSAQWRSYFDQQMIVGGLNMNSTNDNDFSFGFASIW